MTSATIEDLLNRARAEGFAAGLAEGERRFASSLVRYVGKNWLGALFDGEYFQAVSAKGLKSWLAARSKRASRGKG